MAFFGLSWAVPSTIGPLAAGLIMDHYDPRWVWYIGGVLCGAAVLAFLPGTRWENLIGFFTSLALISVIGQLLFLVPRKIAQKIWKQGMLSRLLGGSLNALNAAIGMVVLALVLGSYPVIDWLAAAVVNASTVMWLVQSLGCIQTMLPEEFHRTAALILIGTSS